MTIEQLFYNDNAAHVEHVAYRFAPVVKRYGWDVEDTKQHALLTLWELSQKSKVRALGTDDVKPYLTVSVRRSILKAARRGVQSGTKVWYDLTSHEDKKRDWLATFVVDILDSAPSDIAVYIRTRLFGITPTIPLTRGLMREASEWLLDQMAGSFR